MSLHKSACGEEMYLAKNFPQLDKKTILGLTQGCCKMYLKYFTLNVTLSTLQKASSPEV